MLPRRIPEFIQLADARREIMRWNVNADLPDSLTWLAFCRDVPMTGGLAETHAVFAVLPIYLWDQAMTWLAVEHPKMCRDKLFRGLAGAAWNDWVSDSPGRAAAMLRLTSAEEAGKAASEAWEMADAMMDAGLDRFSDADIAAAQCLAWFKGRPLPEGGEVYVDEGVCGNVIDLAEDILARRKEGVRGGRDALILGWMTASLRAGIGKPHSAGGRK